MSQHGRIVAACSVAGDEQRLAFRHLTSANVAVMHVGTEEDFCRIRNISETGLMAHVYRSLDVGENVRIELNSGHVVEGCVVWAEDHIPALASRIVRRAGVKFRDPVEVEPILSNRDMNAAGRLQRWARVNLRCPVRMNFDGRQVGGRLCDISQGGAKIQTPGGFTSETQGSILLRDFEPVHGSVRWSNGSLTGFAFDEAVKLEPLAAWIQGRRAEAVLDAFRLAAPYLPDA
jgi:hypothetical protein